MKEKFLKVCLKISILTGNLDFFQDAVYLTMAPDAGDWPFQARQNANNAVNCMQKLFWESICCATAESKAALTSEVLIDIQCGEFEGGLERWLVDETDGYFAWTPALSLQIELVSGQLRKEIAEMLCNLAHVYYSGSLEELGGQNEFRLRY